jgi:glycosyltransferase involved in cell wall biosynthesis
MTWRDVEAVDIRAAQRGAAERIGDLAVGTTSPRVLALVHPEMMAGCTAWRIAQPFSELHRRGYPVGWCAVGDARSADWLRDADAVVMARLEWAPEQDWVADRWVALMHGLGTTVIYETDDDLYSEESIDRIRVTGDPAQANKPQELMERERQARILPLALSDGVTVATPRLAEVVSRFTDKPVIVVPNAIDLPRFRAGVEKYGPKRGALDPDRPLTIGWAGGNRPDEDARHLAVAWTRIANRYPDVRFLVGGYPLGVLLRSVDADRLTLRPKETIERYPGLMAEIDILCCPLEANTFNASKSPIKALEGAAAGSAVLASPTVYRHLIDHGEDGLICTNADDWEASLSWLIEDRARRRHFADRLLQKVESLHSLQANAHRWPAAWSHLVADYTARQAGIPTTVGGTDG